MSKRLAAIFVPVLILVSGVLAQVNEVSITGGRTFVSTQTLTPATCNQPICTLHFGNDATIDFNYARLLWTHKIFGLYGELPVAYEPGMNLNTPSHPIPNNIGFLFVTPSARLNIFSGDSVTPWVSFGGGYGRWRESSNANFYGTNPGPGSNNTGAIQFGGGLDVWYWPNWGGRFEFRDFYSGKPDIYLETTNGRQHNYYVGVGIMHRF
jgi:hypothetical protein